MKKIVFSILLSAVVMFAFAQNAVFNFENLNVPDTGFWNGGDNSHYNGFFGDSNLHFVNDYQGQYFWSGFAFSNWTDTLTNDYSNQWSTFAGSAHSDSIFGVGYVNFDWNSPFSTFPIVSNFVNKVKIDSFFITNSTYTATTIKLGSAYSSPFSTSQHDYYKIVMNFFDNENLVATKDTYLADYRTLDSFVVDYWLKVDLTDIDSINKITFDAVTTDIGSYGPNTPLYFCVDDFYYSTSPETTSSLKAQTLTVYPNPAAKYIIISDFAENVKIFDLKGELVKQCLINSANAQIDISGLMNGVYVVSIQTTEGFKNARFVKK